MSELNTHLESVQALLDGLRVVERKFPPESRYRFTFLVSEVFKEGTSEHTLLKSILEEADATLVSTIESPIIDEGYITTTFISMGILTIIHKTDPETGDIATKITLADLATEEVMAMFMGSQELDLGEFTKTALFPRIVKEQLEAVKDQQPSDSPMGTIEGVVNS